MYKKRKRYSTYRWYDILIGVLLFLIVIIFQNGFGKLKPTNLQQNYGEEKAISGMTDRDNNIDEKETFISSDLEELEAYFSQCLSQLQPEIKMCYVNSDIEDENILIDKLQNEFYSNLINYNDPDNLDDGAVQMQYVNSHTWKIQSIVNYGYMITVTFEYRNEMTSEKEVAADEIMKKAVDQMGLLGSSEAEKAKKIHDWVVMHIDYDETKQSCTDYQALTSGYGVCASYAMIFNKMAEYAGLEVDYVVGKVYGQDGLGDHAWNKVRINGEWLYVDCTWDDTYTLGQATISDQYFLKSYDYFMMNKHVFSEKMCAE